MREAAQTLDQNFKIVVWAKPFEKLTLETEVLSIAVNVGVVFDSHIASVAVGRKRNPCSSDETGIVFSLQVECRSPKCKE